MTELRRQHIEKQLQEIEAWRASGLPLVNYAEQQGQALADWRGKLSWGEAKPSLQALYEWLMATRSKVPHGTATAKAIDCALKRWPALVRYCGCQLALLLTHWKAPAAALNYFLASGKGGGGRILTFEPAPYNASPSFQEDILIWRKPEL